MIRILIGLFALLVVVSTTDIAQAQNLNRQVKHNNVPDVDESKERGLFGAVTIMSDYRSGGFTSSDEDPAIQGEIGYYVRGFYAGVSAGNVDFGKINGNEIADWEVNLYAGYIRHMGRWEWDIGISYSHFPDAYDRDAELDYWEGSVGLMATVHENMRAGVRIYYSPDYSGESGDNWVFEGTVERELRQIRGITPVLSASIGYQDGDEDKGNFDYWFWDAGLELQVHEHVSIDLRYHDADDVPFSCDSLCDAAFVGSLTVSF